MTRPFRILGLQQIAVGAPKKDELRKLWVDIPRRGGCGGLFRSTRQYVTS
jgi:hypothetical protein